MCKVCYSLALKDHVDNLWHYIKLILSLEFSMTLKALNILAVDLHSLPHFLLYHPQPELQPPQIILRIF